jgi:hypothetical protein
MKEPFSLFIIIFVAFSICRLGTTPHDFPRAKLTYSSNLAFTLGLCGDEKSMLWLAHTRDLSIVDVTIPASPTEVQVCAYQQFFRGTK